MTGNDDYFGVIHLLVRLRGTSFEISRFGDQHTDGYREKLLEKGMVNYVDKVRFLV